MLMFLPGMDGTTSMRQVPAWGLLPDDIWARVVGLLHFKHILVRLSDLLHAHGLSGASQGVEPDARVDIIKAHPVLDL
jgi:hypothetical protein